MTLRLPHLPFLRARHGAALVMAAMALAPAAALAQPAGVQLRETGTASTRFVITVPAPKLAPLAWAADVQSIGIEGYETTARPGETALPSRVVLVAIPANGDVAIDVRASSVVAHEGIVLATQPVLRSRKVSDPVEDAGARLSMLANRGRRPGPATEEPWARLESIGWLREQRVARIRVQPARYDLATRRVSVAGEIEISVRSSGAVTPSRMTRPDRGTPDPFEIVYQGALVNPEQGRAWRWRMRPGTAPSGANQVEAMQATVVPDTSIYAGRSWVKLAVGQSGLYKVAWSQVRQSRLFGNSANVPLDSLRLFTLPGYPMLPEGNYCDSCDYREVAIQLFADADAVFDDNDYFYFYALGPSDWADIYDPSRPNLEFVNNPYELQNIYFLTFGEAPPGKPLGGTPRRIPTRSGAIGDPTGTTTPTTFAARAHFEQDNEYEVDAAPTQNPPDARFDVSSTRDTLFWEKWFWKSVSQGTEASTDPSDLPGLDATQPIRLRARWWGLNQNVDRSDGVEDHYLQGYLNGVRVINASWSALLPQTVDTTMMAPVTSGFQVRTVVPRVIDPRPDYDAVRNDRVGFAWFDIFYQRRFQPVGDALLFETQGGGSYVYAIGPFQSATLPHVFDVTDPLTPVEITGFEYAGLPGAITLRFRSDETTPRRYRIIPESEFKNLPPNAISNAAASSLTNLRSTTRKADYLLIYFDEFGTAAQELLAWRQQHMPMGAKTAPFDTASVPISAIYDQFSGGRLDPTALRNFLRAVYYNWRAGGHDPPTYVCLLGDASSDFKNITGNVGAGAAGTFVPSYEGGWDFQVARAFASDDWLLNVDNPTRTIPDFLAGRIPARDAGSAVAYVKDKLIPYESTAPVGTWRNTLMFIADDNMQGSAPDRLVWEHVRQTNELNVGNTPQHIDRDYVYLHTYPTTAQFTKAQARTDIVNGINEGRVMVNYIGHGSPFQISDERVYVPGDADNQTNATRLNVFVAASCDVGKFNDPLDSSIGEKLVLNPVGGSIAVISATELAFSGENSRLNITLYREIFRRDSLTGTYYTPLGAGLLRAKTGTINNQKYQLMGDAATRLLLPFKTVELAFVDANDQPDTVARRGNPLRFKGRILDRPGGTVVPYDGNLELLIEDSAPIDATSGGVDYQFAASPMYRGSVEVHGGLFSGQIVVPVDARAGNLGRGRGYLVPASNLYDQDAVGSHGLLVQAASPLAGDVTGPSISLSFAGGSTTVRPDAQLKIDIADPSGILITGNTPQNGIIVTVDESSTQRYDVTPSFRYATGSYQAGSASFTLPNLSPGPHVIRVSAADNLAGGITAAEHRSSTTIAFSVSDNPTLSVTRAFLFPNPTRSGGAGGGGTFIIDVPGDPVNVLLRIYSVSGRLIRELTSFGGQGQVHVPWDGLDAEGDKLANGVYLYRVHVNPREADGTSSPRQKATAEGRLVIVAH